MNTEKKIRGYKLKMQNRLHNNSSRRRHHWSGDDRNGNSGIHWNSYIVVGGGQNFQKMLPMEKMVESMCSVLRPGTIHKFYHKAFNNLVKVNGVEF